jgi:uncharacterized repeat protein (TIGR02543 family)
MALGMSAAIAPAATAATSTCTPDVSTIAQCFPDPNLADVVADAANHGVSQPLTKHDIASITGLPIRYEPITNLQGIESLTNRTHLELEDNQISDVSPLAKLTHLTDLDLDGNQISDVSPLAKLTHLTTLGLGDNMYGGNEVSDIGPLSNLTNLTLLDLDGNQISDVSPLSNLTHLTDLDLDGNQISDVSPLAKLTNLTNLELGSQSVSLPVAAASSVSVSTAKSVDGSFVQPYALDTSFGSYDAKTGRVTWEGLSGSGTVDMHASTTVTIGKTSSWFDVTITQPYAAPTAPVAYSVSFDAQGGSAVVFQSVVEGGKAIKPASPSRSGYAFTGWTSDKAGSKPYDFSTAVTGNITLYAQWKAVTKPTPTYTVSFDANGGKFANGTAMQKASVKQGAKYALAAAPVRSGYTFTGWFTARTGGSKVTGTPTATGSRTLYAQWAKNTPSPKPSLGTPVVVYRVYNKNSGLHHYTTNLAEKNALVKLGWKSEGASFNAAKQNSASGLKPVYREYNPHNGNHNWTLNPTEHKQLVKLGWKDEGVAWYANPAGPVTVYRLYNPHSGEHVYTTSAKEYAAVGAAGWHQEGTAWKGL